MDDALKFLVERLKEAQDHTPQSNDPDTNLKRHIAMEALSAVIGYLREAGIDLKLRAPLLGLLGALGDVSCGRSNALLTKIPYEGGPKKPLYARWNMVTASAAVTLWVHDAKWQPHKALKEASHIIGVPYVMLHNFRKELTRGNSRVPKGDVEHYK